MEAAVVRQENPRRVKGLLARFRNSNKKAERSERSSSKKVDEPVPSSPIPEPSIPVNDSVPPSVTKDGVPVVTSTNADQFHPSDAHPTQSPPKQAETKRRNRQRNEVTFEKPPPARVAAFSGPPRYDWIDIETAAAIKVQAAYRRNKVMADLEKQGKSTAAIRNRSRRRKARKKLTVSEDVPSFFQCCGAALAFGDGTTDQDWEAERVYKKEQYEEKKRTKAEKEEQLRRHFYKARKSEQVKEQFEVVE